MHWTGAHPLQRRLLVLSRQLNHVSSAMSEVQEAVLRL